MKICPYCQAQNDDDSKFCTACGESLPEDLATLPDAAPADERPACSIENDTPFTQSALKKFYGWIKICSIVFLVLGAICALCTLFVFLADGDEDLFGSLAGTILLIVLGIVYLYLYRSATTKNKLITQTSRQYYYFEETGIRAIFSDQGKTSGEQFVSYGQISKVTRRKNFLLIYFGTQGWLVDTTAFVKGSEGEAIALLRTKCPPKVVKV